MNKRKARKIILRNFMPGGEWEFSCSRGKEFSLFIKAIRKLKPKVDFLGEGRIMVVLNPHETLKKRRNEKKIEKESIKENPQ